MTLAQIKSAIAEGKKVYWSNEGSQVILDSKGQYLIKCAWNGHCVGLTWADGVTMNGREDQFFILEQGRVI